MLSVKTTLDVIIVFFEGKTVVGCIESTISNGAFVIKHGALVGGSGKYLERSLNE